ncbi:type IV fimbrial biogenesis protein FimT [Neisseria perflava]|uniref:pilus assembly FimT family protein n=1 Tax=Neisseria perflava TaxID=33053 RepID=UPI0020A14D0E|nr:GspH/FimT family pseudopilin [Neisseria perflava]MCP1771238.1 type IV fimbrial biogenesis protein FimT [Neisseria perflava]
MPEQSKGFTLIELLVVIAITAIMAIIAFPNFNQWLSSRRAATQAEQIANLLRFARGEAVRLNLPVYVCPAQIKSDGKAQSQCSLKYINQGMFAFADVNSDEDYDSDDNDISLRTLILTPSTDTQKVAYTFQTCDFSGECTSGSNNIWAYYPDGTFGYSTAMGEKSSFNIAQGYVKIALTDYNADTDDEKAARASVVLIDSSGRAEVCAKSDTRTLCEYPES